jgi:hypothetical protein
MIPFGSERYRDKGKRISAKCNRKGKKDKRKIKRKKVVYIQKRGKYRKKHG